MATNISIANKTPSKPWSVEMTVTGPAQKAVQALLQKASKTSITAKWSSCQGRWRVFCEVGKS
jgi:uncharacterized cupin superfamily protein